MKHTFAICAYKESPYLESCIKSLIRQRDVSNVIITTSTDNIYIRKMAEKYHIPLYVREGEPNIALDWNFGYEKALTQYVTLAHQDDIYSAHYAKRAVECMEKAEHPLIYFTDYGEIRKGKPVISNKLLNIKRIMLLPLRVKKAEKSIWIRRRILSFGSPVCCPSVTFCKTNLGENVFSKGFRGAVDWEAWEKISKLKGELLYDTKTLMYHRIHAGSETSAIIKNNARSEEDLMIYKKFWPLPVAKLLMKLYAGSQKSNNID